jgi:hypothetical protein
MASGIIILSGESMPNLGKTDASAGAVMPEKGGTAYE